MEEKLLTPEDVAKYLDISIITIYRWLKAGTLKATRFGRQWRILKSDLVKFGEPNNEEQDS